MKLLFVDCCISQRGPASRTLLLASAYSKAFLEKWPDAEIEIVLPETLLALKPFDEAMLDERDALASVEAWDAPVFELARQFRAADRIVVAAPFWDLSFPSVLRTYIEYICANGLAYHYEVDGCHGDCRAEHLVYLTSGGDFERENSIGVEYWRQLCAMLGIGTFDYVFAGGLDADPALAPERLEAACALARRLAEKF